MTKYNLSFWIMFFFCSYSINILAQQSIIVKGTVENNPNVNIVLEGTQYGTSTNEEGEYSLFVFIDENPIQLHFSKVGFKDTIVQINNTINIPDTVYINISLKKLSYQLNEVTIETYADFYRINDGIIEDIAFLNDYIFLLIKKRDDSEIEILNENGELLLHHKLHLKYEMIYKDCFENLILVGKDSCLQFYFDTADTSFIDIENFSMETFNKKLKPVILKFGCMFLFKENFYDKSNTFVDKYHNKKINYYYVNTRSSVKEEGLLVSFFDEKAYWVSASYFNDIVSLYNQITPSHLNVISNGVWDGNLMHLSGSPNGSPKLFNLISLYQKVESTPINVEAFKKNNELLFFNLTDNTILRYNQSFELLDTTSLNSTQKPKITNLLQDEKNENVYAGFEKNGFYYLGSINTVSGSVADMNKANIQPFPKLLKIYNNYAYTAYYDVERKISRVLRKALKK